MHTVSLALSLSNVRPGAAGRVTPLPADKLTKFNFTSCKLMMESSEPPATTLRIVHLTANLVARGLISLVVLDIA